VQIREEALFMVWNGWPEQDVTSWPVTYAATFIGFIST